MGAARLGSRRLIASTVLALMLAVGSPNPHVGLEDALRIAQVTQWNATTTWNEAVARNQYLEAYQRRRRYSHTMPYTTGDSNTAARPNSPSQSPTSSSWNSVAQCESGGNWSTNTGSGYYGGLQESLAFWQAHGGLAYTPRPDLASPDEQATVAERAGSRAPWPVCGDR